MADEPDVRVETVRKLELKPGDVLHVQLGIADMGDGQGPWIPGPEHILRSAQDWRLACPTGVRVIVTHFGENIEVIRQAEFDGDVGVVLPLHDGVVND